MTTAAKDRIRLVEILDTFGIEELRFEPGSVTRIRGKNGKGKSSVLNAMLYVFRGGCDPSVIRKGTLKSTVRFELESGVSITKTTGQMKRGGFRAGVEILDPEGLPVAAPQTYVSELGQALAVDPGAILRIDTTKSEGKKELVALINRVAPQEFKPEELAAPLSYEEVKAGPGPIWKLTGTKWIGSRTPATAAAVPDAPIGLDGVKAIEDLVREKRRRANTIAEEARSTVDSLRPPGSPEPGEDVSEQLRTAEAALVAIDAAIAADKQAIGVDKQAALDQARDAYDAVCRDVDEEIDGKIRELEAERRTRLAAAERTLQSERNRVLEAAAMFEKEATDVRFPERDALVGTVAALRQQVQDSAKIRTLHEQAERFLVRQLEYSHVATALGEVLERLAALRRAKSQASPVPGLELLDGEVLVDGVEWHNVNTARRVEIAMQLCALVSGRLLFMVLDDAEHLDAETRAALEQAIVAGGWQLVETIVGDMSALQVETEQMEVAA